MKLITRNTYNTAANRKHLAEFLSATIEGDSSRGFSPYKPNEKDDTFWTLDSGNDWKVKFYPESPNIFEIIYRYQCPANQFEEALAGWLKVRMCAITMEEYMVSQKFPSKF